MAESRSKPLDLQDLALLNQEIAALVRAGVPLEAGLDQAGRSGEGAQELLMLRLAQRLREGRSFSEAMQIEGAELPKLYRAVVEAGARTGRLPDALESLAKFAQQTLELRRRVDLALLYPALVALIASLLFVWLVAFWVPRLSSAFYWLQIPATDWVLRLEWLRVRIWSWAWIGPSLVIGLMSWWWFSTRGRYGLKGATDTTGWSAFGIVPGIRTIVASFRQANFCDLLAMLLDHQVPLPDATLLAAEAAGDVGLRRVAGRVADGIRSGHTLADCLAVGRELPPFVSWMLVCGERQGTLVPTLRQVAEVLRQRAASQSDWLRVVLPTTLVVLVGGTAVLVYALAVFVPLSDLLRSVGELNA